MQQAITWTNVDPDLCRYIESLGHNDLKEVIFLNENVSIYTVYIWNITTDDKSSLL